MCDALYNSPKEVCLPFTSVPSAVLYFSRSLPLTHLFMYVKKYNKFREIFYYLKKNFQLLHLPPDFRLVYFSTVVPPTRAPLPPSTTNYPHQRHILLPLRDFYLSHYQRVGTLTWVNLIGNFLLILLCKTIHIKWC